MAFNVNLFTGALQFGGARNALFSVQITNPRNGAADLQVPFMVKAAQIPASTLGQVDVPYFGRLIKLAGNRTFAEWTPTIINDEDFAIRHTLEEWQNAINTFQSNLREFSSASPASYKSQAQVTQFSKTGAVLRVYDLVGIWPSDIQTIDLAWDSVDTIEEYTVTFTYDYHTVSTGITGTISG